MIVVVRHAMPAFSREVPPERWVLGDEGRAAAAALALPGDALLVASAEPKAWQTLEPAGAVLRDERFNEVRRRGEPWDGGYRELRRAYVDGTDHPGWEPRTQIAERFDDAITHHLARADGRPLVVATHGMAMTVWLTHRVGLADPGGFWADLRFPDAHTVDLHTGQVRRYRTHPAAT